MLYSYTQTAQLLAFISFPSHILPIALHLTEIKSSRPLSGLNGRERFHRHIPIRKRDARQSITLRILPQRARLVQALSVGAPRPSRHVHDARSAQLLPLAVGPSGDALVDVDPVVGEDLPDVAPRRRLDVSRGLVLRSLILDDGDGDRFLLRRRSSSRAQGLQFVLRSAEEDEVHLDDFTIQRGERAHDLIEGCADQIHRLGRSIVLGRRRNDHRSQLADLISHLDLPR
mmetsp:Transcript_9976/g.17485  ORF Transcript_9976/g.17485 Transcript_9976/m.17485 type:complete len:229 (+) Transcript_9976:97-783(+)